MKLSKKMWVRGAVVVLAVVLVSAGTVLYLRHRHEMAVKHQQSLQAVSTAKKLQIDSPVNGQLTYYINLGGSYANANQHQQALDSYLKADTYITNRSGKDGNSVNVLIAEEYLALGNKQKARQYYDRELTRLAAQPNDSVAQYVRSQEAKL